jgi:hypothetical protein
MPSSAVRTFTEPDEYAASIRAGEVELTVTGRGAFTGKIIRIDLHRLWMQRLSDNLERVVHAANGPERAIITFRIELCRAFSPLGLKCIRTPSSGTATASTTINARPDPPVLPACHCR